jgi:L-alanine-DL-glutamate epimerase-like enolase superfamily enzyme
MTVSGTGFTLISTKIRKLELQNTWTISRNSSSFKENVFVRLEKHGITGYGEAAPNVRYSETPEMTESMILIVSEALMQQDLFDRTRVTEILDELIVAQNCAKAALDIAVMDWVAKSLTMPLYKLLGLEADKTPLTSYSIGIDDIGEIKRKTAEAEDYPILKIKVGHQNDEDIINTVRSVTDKPIRIDANEGWKDKETAIKKIQWMQSRGVEFIEQPMPAKMLEETAWLKQRVSIPLVADEAVLTAADIPSLAEAYDGINIKLMKAGGIQEALKMIHAARAVNLKVMIGCMIESSLAITAAAHLSPLADWADLDGNLLIRNDPYSGVKVSHGRMFLNEQPGIGVTGSW